jgi:hypothetical protein
VSIVYPKVTAIKPSYGERRRSCGSMLAVPSHRLDRASPTLGRQEHVVEMHRNKAMIYG